MTQKKTCERCRCANLEYAQGWKCSLGYAVDPLDGKSDQSLVERLTADLAQAEEGRRTNAGLYERAIQERNEARWLAAKHASALEEILSPSLVRYSNVCAGMREVGEIARCSLGRD